ncbi:UNVERIFIED_CONTAM: uncharacterized protein (TIGR03086 family) [Streptomyces canus]
MDVVELDRIAVQEAARVVESARDGDDGDWERETPCAGWNLRRLVAHMTAQHHGFAAAARGVGGDPGYWREREGTREPARAHRAAADAVLGAFGERGVLEREFVLPELGGGFPGRTAIAFHFVDYVVHAWDVAAHARPATPPDERGAHRGPGRGPTRPDGPRRPRSGLRVRARTEGH